MKLSKSFGLLLSLFLSGCVLTSLVRPDPPTPEQIAAWNEIGYDVYTCFNVSGPPPTGGFTILVFPKDEKPEVSFSMNCQIVKANVNVDG